ncbi:hypothetical protein HPB50_025360 [Hyalomma asiaticum]|uniref:Uncharacterized protein n=1 Tax=Hyalomma asiaticum TaxID=266040 RepID=A0ACB7RXC7_HYAAI|nr:hypothetical protein HPB50_025360 [Hyalomma asiaticum]
MSSCATSSQPTPATANFIGPLLPDIWIEVFRYLDAQSLMNMAEAVPEVKSTAFSRTILRRVTFAPETNEQTVNKFLEAIDEKLVQDKQQADDARSLHPVEELRFTGCRTLPSRAIIICAGHFSNLRELYCVKCVLQPDELFSMLSLRLKCLKTLHWSIFDCHICELKMYSDAMLEIRSLAMSDVSPSVNSMYVEVAATAMTVLLFHTFVGSCGSLRSLHVHAMLPQYSAASTVQTFYGIVDWNLQNIGRIRDRMVNLETWKFTSEL